jgi:glycosyltransferase involved in cell wall biosynthesis
MSTSRPELSFVLPAYNEAQNVPVMAARLGEIARQFGSYEIIFVDDGSTDATLPQIRALAAENPALRYVSFTRNFGHQAALRAGLRHARGKGVVVMDCDFQNPPEAIPALVAKWRAGAKVVATRRIYNAAASSFAKRFTSKLFYRVLDAIGDVRIEPGAADFFLLDHAVVAVINGFEDQDIFLRGLIRWLGFPIAQVDFLQQARAAGYSKFTVRRMVDFAITGIVAHSVRPLRLAIHLALIFAAVGFGLVLYSVASFIWIDRTVVGWTSLMAAVALLGAGQLLVLGIVGEYVGRILREARKWPIYIVAETENAVAPAEHPASIEAARQRAR